jgi:nucleoside-diphosphate kinase
LVIKPDGVKRKLVGEIIKRIEQYGFKIIDVNFTRLTRKQASEFYAIHKGKDFFLPLVSFIIEGPVLALLLQRKNGQKLLRVIVGATDPKQAKKGTIRADFGTSTQRNVVHAANPAEDPQREINFFFKNKK